MNNKKKLLILSGVFVLLILLRIFVTFLIFNSNPFIGYMQYLRLVIEDELFWIALLNTIIPLSLAALFCVVILVFFRNSRLKQSKTAFFDRRYFPCAFVILLLINRITTLFMSIIPFFQHTPEYTAFDSVIPLTSYLLDTVLITFISPQGILDSAIYALFFCFILWVIALVQIKRISEQKTFEIEG